MIKQNEIVMSTVTKLGIVIPCYNEEEVLETSVNSISGLLERYIRGKPCVTGQFYWIG
jgi:hypothetical protein